MILIFFIIGVICMRSAGCIINDCIDCNIDSLVYRTKDRPLSSGVISKKEALLTLIILLVIAASLVLTFNYITVLLSLIALLLSVIYPYLKRYIYYPQLILGIIFSFPILMGSTVICHSIDRTTWLLFLINVFWVMVYDTQYAMMDRDDDKRIGIKSFAILFGKLDKVIIGFFQSIIILILWIVAWQEKFSVIFYFFSLYGVIFIFIRQQVLIYNEKYFQAFLSNNYVGMLIFIGLLLNFSDDKF